MGLVVLMYGVEGRPDVFSAGVTDNVVDGVEDVAAALGQNIQTLGDLCCDFLWGAIGQNILRVYPPPQNTSLSPYFSLSMCASMPLADSCTGLMISIPMSTKSSSSLTTQPQVWKKVFQLVFW